MNAKSHSIECAACGCEGEVVAEGIMDLSDALPKRWKRRMINHQAYILCDVCGHPRQFTNGLSRYLLDMLALPENATVELPEMGDFVTPMKAQRKSRGDSQPNFSNTTVKPGRRHK